MDSRCKAYIPCNASCATCEIACIPYRIDHRCTEHIVLAKIKSDGDGCRLIRVIRDLPERARQALGAAAVNFAG